MFFPQKNIFFEDIFVHGLNRGQKKSGFICKLFATQILQARNI